MHAQRNLRHSNLKKPGQHDAAATAKATMAQPSVVHIQQVALPAPRIQETKPRHARVEPLNKLASKLRQEQARYVNSEGFSSSVQGRQSVGAQSTGTACTAHAAITSAIKSCTTWHDAFKIFIDYSDVFNGINISALVNQMAKLLSARWNSRHTMRADERQSLREALAELHDFAEAELPRLGPRELANTSHGLSKLGILSKRFTQLLVARAVPHAFNNQELCSLLVALARAGHKPADTRWLYAVWQEVADRSAMLSHQELCNALWALAKLQARPGAAQLHAIILELDSRAAYLLPIDLAHALWSLSVLLYRPADTSLLNSLFASCADQACGMSPQNSSLILWAVATAGWFVPPMWVAHMCQSLRLHVPPAHEHANSQEATFRERAASNTTAAGEEGVARESAASIQVSDSTQQPGSVTQESTVGGFAAVRRPQFNKGINVIPHGMVGSPASSVVISTGEANVIEGRGVVPGSDQWRDVTSDAAQTSSNAHASVEYVGRTVNKWHARPRQQQQLQHQWAEPPFSAASGVSNTTCDETEELADAPPCDVSYHGRHRVSSHDAALALYALARMQHAGSKQLIVDLVHVVLGPSCQTCAPQDLANCMWATTRLGYKVPPELLNCVVAVTQARMSEFTEVQIACLACALARQHAQPSEAWFRTVCWHLLYRHEAWRSREVAHILWAFARMRHRLSGRVLSVLLHTVLHPGDDSWTKNNTHKTAQAQHAAADGSQEQLLRQNVQLQTVQFHPSHEAAQPVDAYGSAIRIKQQNKRLLHSAVGRHQHIANTMMAIPVLLPQKERAVFGHLNRSLLQEVEEVTMSMLGKTAQATGSIRNDAEQVWSMQGDIAALNGNSNAGWQPCELLQVLESFTLLRHRPCEAWLHAHQNQVACHWPLLTHGQQNSILKCYTFLAGQSALDHLHHLHAMTNVGLHALDAPAQ